MKPVVYISGPMTGKPDLNFPAFNRAAEDFRGLGFDVVNPVDINPDPNAKWKDCMRADINALFDCSHIALLPGWEKSKGARIEFDIAMALEMEPIYLNPEPQADSCVQLKG